MFWGLPLGMLLFRLSKLRLELLDLFLEIRVVVLQTVQGAIQVTFLQDRLTGDLLSTKLFSLNLKQCNNLLSKPQTCNCYKKVLVIYSTCERTVRGNNYIIHQRSSFFFLHLFMNYMLAKCWQIYKIHTLSNVFFRADLSFSSLTEERSISDFSVSRLAICRDSSWTRSCSSCFSELIFWMFWLRSCSLSCLCTNI